MKTIPKVAILVVAAAIIPAAAVHAGDTVKNYRSGQKHTTFALTNNTIVQTAPKADEQKLVYRKVATGQGPVGFFAPAN
jgi:hypothetical protein